MTLPDLSSLTFAQVATLALILAVADTIWNIVTALAAKTFSAAAVAQFLETHVLLRIVPILLLAGLGSGLFGLPTISAFFDASIAALGAYLVETVGSLIAASQKIIAPAPPTA